MVGAGRRSLVTAAVLLSPLALAALVSLAGVRGAYLAALLIAGYFFAAMFIISYHDATTLVSCFIAVTVLIPAGLTVGSLGAAGSPTTTIGVAAFVWWGLSHLGGSESIGRGRQPIRIAIFIFGAAILLSYGAAFSRQIPPIEASAANRGLLELFGLAGVALLTADGVRDRGRFDVLGRRLVFWVSVLAVLGVIQFVTRTTYANIYSHLPGFQYSTGSPIVLGSRGGRVRVQGTASSPIEFGLVMAAVLPLAVHYALYASGRRRIASWATVLLIAVSIALSGSRAGIVGFAAAFIVLLLGWNSQRRAAAVAAVLAVVAVMRMALPGLIGGLIGDLLNASTDPDVTHRAQDLARSGFLISRSVWFGRGFLTFIPKEFTPPGQPVASLDNQYLGTLIETGIVGLLALVLLLLVWMFTALGARRRAHAESTRNFALSLAASCASMMIGFYVFDVFGFDMTANMTFVLLGMTGALWRLVQTEDLAAQPVPLTLKVGADAQ